MMDTITFSLAMILGIPLAFLLVRHRHYSEYPFFSAYVVSVLIASLVRFFTLDKPWPYFISYWTTEVFLKILAMASLYEVFRNVFGAFTVYKRFRFFFPLLVTLVLLVAVWLGIKYPPARKSKIVILILNMEVGINLIQASIMVMFFTLSSFFRIRWRSQPLAIVEGFATIGVAGLFYLLTFDNPVLNIILMYVAPFSSIVALILWLGSFRRPRDPDNQWPADMNQREWLGKVKGYSSNLKKIRGNS
jgi:hypothetical protein